MAGGWGSIVAGGLSALLLVLLADAGADGVKRLRNGDHSRVPVGRPAWSRGRALAVQTCSARYTTDSAFWVLSCAGGSCSAPSCPAGWDADSSQPKCSMAGGAWDVPHCRPFTTMITPHGSMTGVTVDNLYELTVMAYNADGVISTAEVRPVTVTLAGSEGSSANWHVTMANGIGKLNISHAVVEDVHLKLASSSYTNNVKFGTLNVTFMHGVVAQYVFTHNTLTGTVDGPVAARVEAKDKHGNLCTAESRGITVQWVGNNITRIYQILSLVGGVGTALVSSDGPGTYSVSLTAPGVSNATYADTMVVILSVGATTQYTFVAPSINSSVGTWAAVTVVARDKFGNVANGEQRDISVIASQGSLSGGIALVNVVNGSGSTAVRHTASGIITLTFSDTQGIGIDATASAAYRFIAGPAVRVALTLTGAGSPGTVDSPSLVSLQALDTFGNLAIAENRAVTVTVTGVTSSGAGKLALSAGLASTAISSQKVQNVTIGLSDTAGTGLNCSATLSVFFLSGMAKTVILASPPLASVQGWPIVTLTAKDQYGNSVTTLSSSVQLVASGSGAVSNAGVAVFDSGIATVTVSATKAELITFSMLDAFHTGLDLSSKSYTSFTAGATTRYILGYNGGSTEALVGNTISVDVSARDQYGNLVGSEQRDVVVNTSLSPTSVVSVAIANGGGVATIGHTKAETLALTLSDMPSSGLDMTSSLSVTFLAGQARSVRFRPGQVAHGTVDNPISLDVQALDQYGNLASGSPNLDVYILATGQGAGSKVTLKRGQGTGYVSHQKVETVAISIQDMYSTGLVCTSTVSLTFDAGAPAKVVLNHVNSAVVGQTTNVTITSMDKFNNSVAVGSARIMVKVGGSASVANNGVVQLSGGSGVASISNTRAESVLLSLFDSFSSGLGMTSTLTVIFLAGPVTTYKLSTTQATVSVHSVAHFYVVPNDQYGNVVSAYSRNVKLVPSAGGASTDVAVIGGWGYASVTHTTAELKTYWITLNNASVAASNSVQVTFTPGPSRSVVLVASGTSTGTVDTPIYVTVKALDSHGNVATIEQRDIEVRQAGVMTGSLGKASLQNGQALVAVPSTKTGVVKVSIHDTYSTTLIFGTSEVSLTFSVGAPAGVSLVSWSAMGAAVGQRPVVVGQDVRVNLETVDQYGNAALAGASSIRLSSTGNTVLADGGTVKFLGGVSNITISNTVAEPVILSMMDTFASGLDVSNTKNLLFVAGPKTTYAFVSPATQTVSVDEGATLQVHALDLFGNIAADTYSSTDVSILSSAGGNKTVVDIIAGVGAVTMMHTRPEQFTFTLYDQMLQMTSSGTVIVTFVAGTTKAVILSAASITGTVDAALLVILTAKDQYSNVAISDPLKVDVGVSGQTIGGAGLVTFSQGLAQVSVSSQLAQTVEVSVGSSRAGLNLISKLQLTFAAGQLHHFTMKSETGQTRVIQKVNKSIRLQTRAEDKYGNLVTAPSPIPVEVELNPTDMTNKLQIPVYTSTDGASTTTKLQITLTNGFGSVGFIRTEPVRLTLRIADAWNGSSAPLKVPSQLITSAVAQSSPFYVDYRLELVPPDYDSLNVISIGSTGVHFGVRGITEPSTIWCVATNISSGGPLTPESTSDGAVFRALRGQTIVSSSAPSVKGTATSSYLNLYIDGMEPTQDYTLRCGMADLHRNHMTGATIAAHQLAITTLREVLLTSTDSDGLSTVVIVILILIGLLALAFCLWAVSVKRNAILAKAKLHAHFAKIVPEPSEAAIAPAASTFNSFTKQLNDSDDEVINLDADKSSNLLRQAELLEAQLLEELGRRGDGDSFGSSESDDSDVSAVLRDVQAFLRNEAEGDDLVRTRSMHLPPLPLMLSDDDEERIAALVGLARQDMPWGQERLAVPWDERLAGFDDLWANVASGPWLETRSVAREEQIAFQQKLEATRRELIEAETVLAGLPERQAIALVDDLALGDQGFMKETSQVLQELHGLTIDWPEEDAKFREALVNEWSSQIREAARLGKQGMRKEAVSAMRALDDRREEELESELEHFEDRVTTKFSECRAAQIEKLLDTCKRLDAQTASHRNDVARLQKQAATEAWHAEREVLNAALQLRTRLRAATVENEVEREAEAREAELERHRSAIEDFLKGDELDTVARRTRALNALERAAKIGRKEALEGKDRRKGYWNKILQERGRERVKIALRRYLEEERRLADVAAKAEETGQDKEALRRAGVTLGVTHRAEAATIAVTAAARRGRILMGLQATAAGSVAAERLPRKSAKEDEGHASISSAALLKPCNQASSTPPPDRQTSDCSFRTTGMRWQAAKRKAAENLNDAIGLVAESLTEHGKKQRHHLSHRQSREAYLARHEQGNDANCEDLLDALEENMQKEIRSVRFAEMATDAEAIARLSSGEETELGKRLAAVVRDSDLLVAEDRIGEHYDKLRAIVLKESPESATKTAPLDQSLEGEARELEREAAELRQQVAEDEDSESEMNMTEWRSAVSADFVPDDEEEESALEALKRVRADRKAERQWWQELARRRAQELRDQGKHSEALQVVATALKDEMRASDLDKEERAKLLEQMMSGMGRMDETAGHEAEAQFLKLEANRLERQNRREEARRRASDLLLLDKANPEVATVLKDEMRASDLDEEERAKLLEQIMSGMERMDETAGHEAEAQRLKLEANRLQRQNRREEARRRASDLLLLDNANPEVAMLAAQALDLAVTTMTETAAASDDDDWQAHGRLRKKIDASVSDAERTRLRNKLADGAQLAQETIADEGEAQRLKVGQRRKERDRRRAAAEQQANELEREAKELRATAKQGGTGSDNSDLDLLSAWQEGVRECVATGALAEACQIGMENAARRLLDSSVTTSERTALKEGFAKEMARCEDVVADEREAQKRKAQERLEARRLRRESAKKEEKATGQGGKLRRLSVAQEAWKKTGHVMSVVKDITRRHRKDQAQKLKEHSEIEGRIRKECQAEMRNLESRLRQEAAEEIARHQARYQAVDQRFTTVTDDDIKKAAEAGAAKVLEAEDHIEDEKLKQASQIEKRLADRKNRLEIKQAALRHGHCQEEVRLELEHEKDKLQKKPLANKKAKTLVKELHRVKNLIGKLRDPLGNIHHSKSAGSSDDTQQSAMVSSQSSPLASAALKALQKQCADPPMKLPLPNQSVGNEVELYGTTSLGGISNASSAIAIARVTTGNAPPEPPPGQAMSNASSRSYGDQSPSIRAIPAPDMIVIQSLS